MIVAVTGHRPERLENKNKEVYDWFVEKFKEYGPDEIYTGMAQGVDQIAAWVAKDNNWNYVCAFPYKRTYFHPEEEALMESGRVIWCSSKYHGPQTYIERDRHMVDCCDVLLAVWDGIEEGGTWQTIKYAREQGKTIIYFPWKGAWEVNIPQVEDEFAKMGILLRDAEGNFRNTYDVLKDCAEAWEKINER